MIKIISFNLFHSLSQLRSKNTSLARNYSHWVYLELYARYSSLIVGAHSPHLYCDEKVSLKVIKDMKLLDESIWWWSKANIRYSHHCARSTLTDKDLWELLHEISSLSPWYVYDSFSTMIMSSQRGIIHDGNHDRYGYYLTSIKDVSTSELLMSLIWQTMLLWEGREMFANHSWDPT